MNVNIEKTIADAEKLGIANPVKVRNLEIRKKFREMRKEFCKYDEAVISLAYEYCLSISSIQQIIKNYKIEP